MTRLIASAALAATSALIAVGCGGPSEEDLLAEANKRCSETIGPVTGLGPMQGEPRRIEARIALQLSGQLDAMRQDIAELEGPEDVRDEIDAYMDHLAERQRGLEEAGELTAEPSAVSSNLELAATSYVDEASDLGLESCAQLETALDESVREAPSL